MDDRKLRAWWFHRQGLDGSLRDRTPAEVLQDTGWARSVAGAGPYLALFARAGTSREAVDNAVAKLAIHELPSARGCTYTLPASDFALGLRVGQEFSTGEMPLARKLGVTDDELEKLCSAVLEAVRQGPLSPDQIREATGAASRSLGAEGAKKGLTTTLPLALGTLQASGQIRRIPINGRLDQQRYRYALWKPSPLTKFRLSIPECYAELARRYFQWIGPATLSEFQWFSGRGVKAVKLAIEPLGLVPVEPGSDRLMFHKERELFAGFKIPSQPTYALVSSMDSMFLLHRSLAQLLTSQVSKQSVYSDQGPAIWAASRISSATPFWIGEPSSDSGNSTPEGARSRGSHLRLLTKGCANAFRGLNPSSTINWGMAAPLVSTALRAGPLG